MARLPRLLIPGHLHLLVQRSAAGLPVFQADGDFELYLAPLKGLAQEHQVAIHAYALLPTQVLMLLTPAYSQSLSRLLQAQGRRFGAAYNRLHQRSGVLWEGRFRATVVDADEYGLVCQQWVETAPYRAGLCAESMDYRWSSAAHHAGLRHDALITEHAMHWRMGNTPFEREALYKAQMRTLPPESLSRKVESAALKGWALGSPAFVRALADVTDRRLTALLQGRPQRKKVDPN